MEKEMERCQPGPGGRSRRISKKGNEDMENSHIIHDNDKP